MSKIDSLGLPPPNEGRHDETVLRTLELGKAHLLQNAFTTLMDKGKNLQTNPDTLQPDIEWKNASPEDLQEFGVTIEGASILRNGKLLAFTPTKLTISKKGEDLIMDYQHYELTQLDAELALLTKTEVQQCLRPDGSRSYITQVSTEELGAKAKGELPESPVRLPEDAMERDYLQEKIQLGDGVTMADLAQRKLEIRGNHRGGYLAVRGQIKPNQTPRTFDSIGVARDSVTAVQIGRSGKDLTIRQIYKEGYASESALCPTTYFIHENGTMTTRQETIN